MVYLQEVSHSDCEFPFHITKHEMIKQLSVCQGLTHRVGPQLMPQDFKTHESKYSAQISPMREIS